jgi:RNA polymerase sigma factor (sigma-70 family)
LTIAGGEQRWRVPDLFEDTAPVSEVKETPMVASKEAMNFCTINEDDVRKYQWRLRAYLRKLTKDQDQVLVLLQEVWLRVIKYKVILQEEVDQFPTLARIAKHAFLDARKRNRPWVALDPENEPAFSEAFQNLEQEDLIQRLEKFFSSLPYPEEKVLRIRYENRDLSWEEVADTLGIKVSTAKKRFYRARRRLRANLSNILR